MSDHDRTEPSDEEQRRLPRSMPSDARSNRESPGENREPEEGPLRGMARHELGTNRAEEAERDSGQYAVNRADRTRNASHLVPVELGHTPIIAYGLQ